MKPYEWAVCVREHAGELPTLTRHLLAVLATYADKDGRCYPTLATLGRVMGIHRNTARRQTRIAVAAGWLVKESGGRWKGDPTHYRITPKGCAHDPLTESQRGALSAPKGTSQVPQRVPPVVPERTKNVQEQRGHVAASADVPRALPQEIPPMSESTVDCRDYTRHQSSHRLDSLKGWVCPVCDDLRQRRDLARAIREAPSEMMRHRYRGSFDKRWANVYGRAAA